MSALADILATEPVAGRRPWPRHRVDGVAWEALARDAAGGRLALLGLWGAEDGVHMALRDPESATVAVASLVCPDGRFPSVGRHHAPAIRLERTIRDLFGLVPEGAPDARSWLDHGHWGVQAPLGTPSGEPQAPDVFLPVEGEGLHEIPVGPVHAGTIEPGHFRFTVNGETVVRLEARLGWVHRGVEGLMAGADLDRAAQIAGRVSGDATVAYAVAFCRAAEAALGVAPPPRAHALRGVMAELERLANHLGDIGAICNDAAFAIMLAECGVLRERVLRAAATAFGHRLMRDGVVPGGVACDLGRAGFQAIRDAIAAVRGRFPAIVALYDGTASLLDRTVGTGILRPELAERFAAGGIVGRASGRDFDARRDVAYPPYDALGFDVPVLEAGDVNARVWIRIREVEQSLALLDRLLEMLPLGGIRAAVAPAAGEGMALVESFRGDVLAWLRLGADGAVARCHLRDPSWFQWPLLEVAIEDNIVADFPLCNKSFNCSYAGQDL